MMMSLIHTSMNRRSYYMKRLSSFMVLNINGGDRISFTFDEIDSETGEPISQNNKQSFFVVNDELASHIEAVRTFIRENKLS